MRIPNRAATMQSLSAQVLGNRHLDVAARLLSTVSLLRRQQPTRTGVGKVILHLLVDVGEDGLIQRFLIALQGQDIVGLAVDNLLGNGFLGSHRVDGDDGSLDVHQGQQFGNGRDFVRDRRLMPPSTTFLQTTGTWSR